MPLRPRNCWRAVVRWVRRVRMSGVVSVVLGVLGWEEEEGKRVRWR
jgi:hypothetical protein